MQPAAVAEENEMYIIGKICGRYQRAMSRRRTESLESDCAFLTYLQTGYAIAT